MKSSTNSIPQSDNIEYWHLQNSLFPLLPFLLLAPVPVVLIWRSSQGSRAAYWSARTEGADGESKGRPPFSVLILQPPFTNFSKYFVMLQGITGGEKASCDSAGIATLQTKRSDQFCSKLLFLLEPTG